MANAFERTAYALGQTARIGLYWGQKWLTARMSAPIRSSRPITGPMPKPADILRDLGDLMRKDWENIAAGYYRLPHDLVTAPIDAVRQAAVYFADFRSVDERRQRRDHQQVWREGSTHRYPRYYLQNFHYQTDGYLSRESATLYDHQVEVLFGGGGDAMRRQALVPLYNFLRGRRIADTALIDIGCGTGRFLTFVKDNYPRLKTAALDLSPYYLEQATARLRQWRDVRFVQAPAERTGLPDASFDVATCMYLFHELPGKVRRQAAAEIARILKPGGILLLVDSIQLGDRPEYDGLIESFSAALHEPYYDDYARCDLASLFVDAGLHPDAIQIAYFSRIMTARKPAAKTRRRGTRH